MVAVTWVKSLYSYKALHSDSKILQQDNNAGKWDESAKRSIIMYIFYYYYLFLGLLFVILGIITQLNFKSPFSHTQAYSSSFFPSVISLWNSLPDEAQKSLLI